MKPYPQKQWQKREPDQPYDPVNKGVMFINDNPKSPESPGWLGNINVAGVEWTLFGREFSYTCKRTGKPKTGYKLSVAVPLDANKKPAPAKATLTEDNWADDDINF